MLACIWIHVTNKACNAELNTASTMLLTRRTGSYAHVGDNFYVALAIPKCNAVGDPDIPVLKQVLIERTKPNLQGLLVRCQHSTEVQASSKLGNLADHILVDIDYEAVTMWSACRIPVSCLFPKK